MEPALLAFINELLKMENSKWQPTDSIPAIVIEALKDLLPWLLPILGAFKASAAIAAQNQVSSQP